MATKTNQGRPAVPSPLAGEGMRDASNKLCWVRGRALRRPLTRLSLLLASLSPLPQGERAQSRAPRLVAYAIALPRKWVRRLGFGAGLAIFSQRGARAVRWWSPPQTDGRRPCRGRAALRGFCPAKWEPIRLPAIPPWDRKPMNKAALALIVHGGTENWSPARWKRRFDEACRDRRVGCCPIRRWIRPTSIMPRSGSRVRANWRLFRTCASFSTSARASMR